MEGNKNSKTQNMTKLKLGHNSRTQIMTQINSNCDKTQKLKLGQNLKYDKSQFNKKKTEQGLLVRTF